MKFYRLSLVILTLLLATFSVYMYFAPVTFQSGDSFKMPWNTPITVLKAGELSVLPASVLSVNGVSRGTTNSALVQPDDTVIHSYPVDDVLYVVKSGEFSVNGLMINWPLFSTSAIGCIYFAILAVISLNEHASYSRKSFGYYTLWAFIGWIVVMSTTYGAIRSTESVYNSPADGIPTEIGPGEYALLTEPATVTIWGLGEQFSVSFPSDMMTLRSEPVLSVPTQYSFSAHLKPGTWENTSSIPLSVLPTSENAVVYRVEDMSMDDGLFFVFIELLIGLFIGGMIAWELFN